MTTQGPPGLPVGPDDDTLLPGYRVDLPTSLLDGKYRVERVIGEGAFGRVYLATDSRLRRNVAVKELLVSRARAGHAVYERYLDRFEREARAAGTLLHPNIVAVHELAVDADNNYYLVMEYVDGTDLRALLTQVGTLAPERVIAIGLDIARALTAVHEHDIIHRDLKPANIMLTRRGVAKLTDFGVAQVATESHRSSTASGHPGTPAYMSPEQANSTGYLDGRSDLYSLGLVMYEMLVGEQWVRQRQPLSVARPDIPPRLLAIVDRLLERNPDARYQRADAVVHDLEQLMAGSQGSQATQPPVATFRPGYLPPATPPARNRRGIAIAIAAIVIAAIGFGIGLFALRGSSGPPATPTVPPTRAPTTGPTPARPGAPTLVPGRPTWTAPNGSLRLQYFQGWTAKTDTSDPTSLLEIDGPDRLIFYVNAISPQRAATVAEEVQRYRAEEANNRDLSFTDRAELDAIVGGEPARMVTVTVRAKNGASPPSLWLYWVVNHGGKEYRFLAMDVGSHSTDVAAIIASVAFTG